MSLKGQGLIDLTGKMFGSWTVLEQAPSLGYQTRWLCQCDCGKKKIVYGGNLAKGLSTSCGCHRLAVQQRKRILRRQRGPENPEFVPWSVPNVEVEPTPSSGLALRLGSYAARPCRIGEHARCSGKNKSKHGMQLDCTCTCHKKKPLEEKENEKV